MENASVANLAASLLQIAPGIQRTLQGFRFLLDQPLIREPYVLSTSADVGQVIPAGARNQPLLGSDFSHSLEFPFEVRKIKFTQDTGHTALQWRILINDFTFNHQWMKNPVVVASLIDTDTQVFELPERWVVRPQGGGMQFFVDNLDAGAAINVYVTLIGSLLIPRS